MYGFGDAVPLGSVNELPQGISVVQLVAHPLHAGYWVLRDDGHVRAFGSPLQRR